MNYGRWAGPAAGCVAFLLAMVLPLGGAEADRSEMDALQAQVSELISLRESSHRESVRWREQKLHLQTTLSLLREEKGQLETLLHLLDERLHGITTEARSLKQRRSAAMEKLLALDAAAGTAADALLATCRRLPPELKTALEPEANRLRELAGREPDCWKTAEKLQLVFRFGADLHRVLGSVHAVKKVLDVPGSPAEEVDVLYLGGIIGYFVSADRRRAGLVRYADGSWTVQHRSELAEKIAAALAVYRKEEPPRLVDLPLPGGEKP